MTSVLVDKIVEVTNTLNQADQEKVLAHAKKIMTARSLEKAYSEDFIPFDISDEEIEKEIKAVRDEKRNKLAGN